MNTGPSLTDTMECKDPIQPHQKVLLALYGQGHCGLPPELWNLPESQTQPERSPQLAHSFISLFKNLLTSALGHVRGTCGFRQKQQIYFEFHRCILKIYRASCHFWLNTRNCGKSNLHQMDLSVWSTRRNHFKLRTRVLYGSDRQIIQSHETDPQSRCSISYFLFSRENGKQKNQQISEADFWVDDNRLGNLFGSTQVQLKYFLKQDIWDFSTLHHLWTTC